jgi:hypothetical protein
MLRQSDPSSALMAPLALLALLYGRKKTRSRWDNLLIILVLGLGVGLSLTACDPAGTYNFTTEYGTAKVVVTPATDASTPDSYTVTATITPSSGSGLSGPIVCSAILTKITDPGTGTTEPGTETIDDELSAYGVTLTENWTDEHKDSVLVAVQLVADSFAKTRKIGETPADAFKAVYNKIHIGWGNCPDCLGTGGFTYGYQSIGDYYLIRFVSLSDPGTYADYKLRQVNNVIHELGHAFNKVMHKAPENLLTNDTDRYKEGYNELLIRGTDRNLYYGFASRLSERVWVQNPSNLPTEVFADQFLGWVCDKWETDSDGDLTDAGIARSNWMVKNMTEWLKP